MQLSTAFDKGRPWVLPLALFWLLCQSMLLCAGSLFLIGQNDQGDVAHAVSSMSFHELSTHSVQPTHASDAHHTSHAHAMADVEQASMGNDHSNMADVSCCDTQDEMINSSLLSGLVLAVMVGLIWFMLTALRRAYRGVFPLPPDRSSYPRIHLVHCSLLN